MWWKCSSEETVVAEAIDLPTPLWQLCVREVDSMKGSRDLIKASALFVETWIIPDERSDLWGSKAESSRSLAPWSRQRAMDINPPRCAFQQLPAVWIHPVFTEAYIYQTACGHFSKGHIALIVMYTKHGSSQRKSHLIHWIKSTVISKLLVLTQCHTIVRKKNGNNGKYTVTQGCARKMCLLKVLCFILNCFSQLTWQGQEISTFLF